MGTPQQVWSMMSWCWQIEPTSERIIEDTLGLPRVLDKIIEREGCVCPDEFLQTGRHQRCSDGKGDIKIKPINRQRKSTNTKMPPIHPVASEALQSFTGKQWEKYEALVIMRE